jgi:hypothetical protein
VEARPPTCGEDDTSVGRWCSFSVNGQTIEKLREIDVHSYLLRKEFFLAVLSKLQKVALSIETSSSKQTWTTIRFPLRVTHLTIGDELVSLFLALLFVCVQ